MLHRSIVVALSLLLAAGAAFGTQAPAPAPPQDADVARTEAQGPDGTAPSAQKGLELSSDPARNFPENTFLYVEIPHLGTIVDMLDIREKAMELANKQLETMAKGAPFKPLTSQEFAAILDASVAGGLVVASDPKAQQPFENGGFTAIVRMGSDDGLDLMRSRVLPLLARGKQQAEKVRGVEVLRGADLSYTIQGRHIVLGQPRGLEAMIETATISERPRFGDDPGYVSFMEKHAGGQYHALTYVNGDSYTKLFAPFFGVSGGGIDNPNIPESQRAMMAAWYAFVGMEALRGLGAVTTIDGEKTTIRFDVEISRQPEGLVSTISDPPSIVFRFPGYLPGNTARLHVLSLDAMRIYDVLARTVLAAEEIHPDQSSVSGYITSIEESIGMKLREELLPAFGNELVLTGDLAFLAQSRPRGQKPDAKEVKDVSVVMLEVKDAETVRRALRGLIATFGLPNIDPATYKEVEFWSAPGAPAAAAFAGDFLILGEEADVKRCIDAMTGGDSLSKNLGFLSVSSRWFGDTIFASYDAFDPATTGVDPTEPVAGDGGPVVPSFGTLTSMLSLMNSQIVRNRSGVNWERTYRTKEMTTGARFVLGQFFPGAGNVESAPMKKAEGGSEKTP